MAITVDSSQWTGERDDTPLPVPIVWGEFADEAARDAALARLRAEGARDGPAPAPAKAAVPPERAVNEGQVDPPDVNPEGADRRNQRQLEVGTAMASTSMLAAGLVIASGGAALPAALAAVAAGAATAAVGEPLASAISPTPPSTSGPVDPPLADGPVIGLRAPDAQARQQAEHALRETGARRVFVQETHAG